MTLFGSLALIWFFVQAFAETAPKDPHFEVAAQAGVLSSRLFPGRPFGTVTVGWRFKPTLALEAQVGWAPREGGSHSAGRMVEIAQTGLGTSPFQAPFAKVTTTAQLLARWTPVTGTISLADEANVLLDVHAVGGVGIALKEDFLACAPNGPNDTTCPGDPAQLIVEQSLGREVELTPVLGLGVAFYVSKRSAIELDVRDTLYFDAPPNYTPDDTAVVGGTRSYGNVASTMGFISRW